MVGLVRTEKKSDRESERVVREERESTYGKWGGNQGRRPYLNPKHNFKHTNVNPIAKFSPLSPA